MGGLREVAKSCVIWQGQNITQYSAQYSSDSPFHLSSSYFPLFSRIVAQSMATRAGASFAVCSCTADHTELCLPSVLTVLGGPEKQMSKLQGIQLCVLHYYSACKQKENTFATQLDYTYCLRQTHIRICWCHGIWIRSIGINCKLQIFQLWWEMCMS